MNVNQTTKLREKNHFWSFITDLIRFNVCSEDYAVLFNMLLFNQYTWILLNLPVKYKALF